MGQLDNHIQIVNEQLMNQIREQICIGESKLLKVLEFDFGSDLPLDYLQQLTAKFCKGSIVEDIFYTTKILILDSYRTYACLCFSSVNIAVACFLLANNYKNYYPYLDPPNKLKEQLDSTQVSEEDLYKKWLQLVSEELGAECNIKDIYECMYLFNELLYLNYEQAEQQNPLNKQKSQENSSNENNQNIQNIVLQQQQIEVICNVKIEQQQQSQQKQF